MSDILSSYRIYLPPLIVCNPAQKSWSPPSNSLRRLAAFAERSFGEWPKWVTRKSGCLSVERTGHLIDEGMTDRLHRRTVTRIPGTHCSAYVHGLRHSASMTNLSDVVSGLWRIEGTPQACFSAVWKRSWINFFR